ncbi:calphotin-like [Trichoplusia ni]|uniref:Calphotin-like n=1 Tax=Trichoplusia ni TaxID=7111 RepID=A0A7E5WRM1_TRINI|nr:calphotin-like [Trichoplusia ni]
MKYFVAIALIAAVASATYVKPTPVSAELAEIQEIVAAINSPSTNPATAAALEEMLWDVLGVKPEPISVGPAIVDFPIAPAPVINPTPIAPSPVSIVDGPAPDNSAALVQIILNINQGAAVPVGPVGPVVAPEPVQVVETAPIPIPVEPVQVVEISPEPVQVEEAAPVPAEPVIIGEPVLPSPAITLPEELN